MARGLTSGMVTELTSGSLRPALACEIDTFSGVNVYVWSGIGTLTWNGHDWLGVGEYANISAIPETVDVIAAGIKLSLSGIPSSLINMALTDLSQGKPARIWLITLDASGNVIADPYQVFAGHVDVPVVNEAAETATIEISVENGLIDLHRPRFRRYTPADQKVDYPYDQGFNYVAQLQQATISWGVPGGIPTWGDVPLSPGFAIIEFALVLALVAGIYVLERWLLRSAVFAVVSMVMGAGLYIAVKRFVQWRQVRRLKGWGKVLGC